MTWQLTPLKKITTKIGSGATPRGGKNSYKTEGITLIRSLNVYDFEFSYEGLAFITEGQASETRLARVIVEPQDILLNITGASVARCCMVPEHLLPARVNQHVSLVRIDPNRADSHYILYCINSPVYKHQLLALAQGGTTREALTKEIIGNFEIPLPSLRTQRKIAAVLSGYDDLIENNTRRIEILEEMTGAIYREWFVEFRFPGHEGMEMTESELGLIPRGWEVKKVKEIVKRLKAGQTYRQTDVKSAGKVIVVDQSRDDFLGFHDNEPDHDASSTDPIIIFGDHTCKMQLMITPFSLGPNVVPFIRKDEMPINYLFFGVSNLVETREYKRHWTELTNKEVAIGDLETRGRFADFTTPIFEQIERLRQKNQNLRQIRDLLLPKLISGEIDVSELDIDIN